MAGTMNKVYISLSIRRFWGEKGKDGSEKGGELISSPLAPYGMILRLGLYPVV